MELFVFAEGETTRDTHIRVHFCPGTMQPLRRLSEAKGKLLFSEGFSWPGGNRRGSMALSTWQTCTRKPASGRRRWWSTDGERPICALGVCVPRGFGLQFSWGYEPNQGALIQIIFRKNVKVLVNVCSVKIRSKWHGQVRVTCILSLEWSFSPLRRIHHSLPRCLDISACPLFISWQNAELYGKQKHENQNKNSLH